MAQVPTPCPKHPAYDAAKPPISGCGWCWRYWNFTQKRTSTNRQTAIRYAKALLNRALGHVR